jgi:stage II sporulation protein AA (anti-sigma F factor antagonist)
VNIQINASDELVTVYLTGEIDHHSAGEIREEIDRSLESNRPKQLVMDFKNVGFMDSSGIGLVMGRYKLMQTMGGNVKIINTPNHIKKVMKLAGLDKLAAIE